eukprot:SAG22_NODE_879_length_6707_cov_14.725787_2_plen_311_part_00
MQTKIQKMLRQNNVYFTSASKTSNKTSFGVIDLSDADRDKLNNVDLAWQDMNRSPDKTEMGARFTVTLKGAQSAKVRARWAENSAVIPSTVLTENQPIVALETKLGDRDRLYVRYFGGWISEKDEDGHLLLEHESVQKKRMMDAAKMQRDNNVKTKKKEQEKIVSSRTQQSADKQPVLQPEDVVTFEEFERWFKKITQDTDPEVPVLPEYMVSKLSQLVTGELLPDAHDPTVAHGYRSRLPDMDFIEDSINSKTRSKVTKEMLLHDKLVKSFDEILGSDSTVNRKQCVDHLVVLPSRYVHTENSRLNERD